MIDRRRFPGIAAGAGAVGGGLFDYRSDAGEFSTATVSGNARMNATYAPSPRWDGQVQANYMAPQGVEGGTRLANFMTSFAGRWTIRGDASVLTLRVTDPFDTQRMRVRTKCDVRRRGGSCQPYTTFHAPSRCNSRLSSRSSSRLSSRTI